MRPLAARDPYREAAPLAPSAPRALHGAARYLLLGNAGAGVQGQPWIRLGLFAAGFTIATLSFLFRLRWSAITLVYWAMGAVFLAGRLMPAIREILGRRRRLRAYRIGSPARGRGWRSPTTRYPCSTIRPIQRRTRAGSSERGRALTRATRAAPRRGSGRELHQERVGRAHADKGP